MPNNFEIRLIRETDAQAVLDIYKYYVDHTVISFEYVSPTLKEYTERIKTNTQKYPWLVCLQNNKIIAFAYGSTHRSRTAYQWSPESTIYVAPNFHSKGIGTILYKTLFSLLTLQGYYAIFAGVALPNEKSVDFHRSLGFEDIGVFRKVGYKHGNWHDTQWFQLQINATIFGPQEPKSLDEIRKLREFEAILTNANNLVLQIKNT